LQPTIIFSLIVVGAYFLNRFAEWRISASNYKILKSAGGEELGSTLLKKYYLICLLVFPTALFEQTLLAPPIYKEMLLLGLLLILTGHMLRYWSISSLGTLWSMRCISLPGLRAINSGPYRYMNNPEYISRFMDGVGISLLTGSKVTGLIYIVLNAIIVRKMSAMEQRQLSELSSGFSHLRRQTV
jgi:methyltransferase